MRKAKDGLAAVDYMLETEDGTFASRMPASVAEEILNRTAAVESGGRIASGRMSFSASDFEEVEWDSANS